MNASQTVPAPTLICQAAKALNKAGAAAGSAIKAGSPTADAMSHRQVVEKHGNALYDVVALLDAAADRIEGATPLHTEDPERADNMHNTLRLLQMAQQIVNAAADDMASVVPARKEPCHG